MNAGSGKMKFTLWLVLLALSVPVFGQDTTSQDLSKEMEENMKHPAPASPFTGDGLSGSGICAGQLLIKPETLTWITVYSECRDVPYRTLQEKRGKDHLYAIYKLETHDKKCMFRVLILHHAAPPDGKQKGFEWNITGYGSWSGYKKKDVGDQLSCNLY